MTLVEVKYKISNLEIDLSKKKKKCTSCHRSAEHTNLGREKWSVCLGMLSEYVA